MASRTAEVPINCAHQAVLPLTEFKFHPNNPNVHTGEQIRLLGKLLLKHGWRRSIRVSRRSGYITAGHGTVMAAAKLRLRVAPVDYQDYASETEELADLIGDNYIATLSVFDRSIVNTIISGKPELDPEDFGVSKRQLEALAKTWDIPLEQITLLSEYSPNQETVIVRVKGIAKEHAQTILEQVTAVVPQTCKVTVK